MSRFGPVALQKSPQSWRVQTRKCHHEGRKDDFRVLLVSSFSFSRCRQSATLLLQTSGVFPGMAIGATARGPSSNFGGKRFSLDCLSAQS